jgi:DNA polymerase III sliding clamp (beta) subunit (PCNA family)
MAQRATKQREFAEHSLGPTTRKEKTMSKISLPIAELKPALTGLGKVVAKRSTLPVLSHIKIERTADGWVAITGTDLDAFITHRLEQPSEGEALSVLVPYDELTKIAKNCQKTDTLRIAGDEKGITVEYPVGGQTAQSKLSSLPVAEFPEIPRIKGEPVPINDSIRQSIHDAFDCASTDETRLILNSAYLDVSKEDGHYVIGTNGSHLFASNSFKLPMKNCFILPSHKFLGFREFNHDGEWRLKFTTPGHKDDVPWFQLSSRRWRFIGRQIEGSYPNWRHVLPSNSDYVTGIVFQAKELEALADSIERLPEHDPLNHLIGIESKERVVNILWKSDRESDWQKLPVNVDKVEGKDITIWLNRQYIIKAFRFGLDRLDCIDPMTPMRWSKDGRQMIVMPVNPTAAVPPKPAESTPTAAPQAQETASPQPAAPTNAANEERTTMPTTETAPTNDTAKSQQPPLTIDVQFELILSDVEALRTSAQDHLTEINGVRTKLKSLQREHKASTKELQTVRQTLKDLQALKI